MNAHRLHIASKRRRIVQRERLLLVLAAVLTGLCCSLLIGLKGGRLVQAAQDSGSHADCLYYTSIEIESGDTLWKLAEEYAPACGMSVSDYIQELRSVNGLESNLIHADQYLTILYCGTAHLPSDI